jgi:phosphoenolpyruvate synthase/pyruvate phosphate dikinase
VWYRVADFWSDEANILKGCDITVEEPNPLVGLRGIRRGFAEPDALDLELKALAQVAATRSNLHVLFPFVQDADELDRCTQFLDRARWPNRFGSMLEIPSALIDVPRMVAVGATNFLVGFNDLSSLLLGRERGGEEIQRHRAMWWAVDYVARHVPAQLEWGIAGRLSKQTIEAARERNVPYASIRYMDLPALLGLDPQQLPDLTLETTIKTRTREQILARRASLKNEPQSS